MNIKVMKTTLFVTIILLIPSMLSAQDYTDIESRITKVTIFPDRAQVNREATLKIADGKKEFRIPGLSPGAIHQSLQVNGQGDFMILSVNIQKNYLDNTDESEELKKMRSRIEELKRKIEDEKTDINILKEKEAFLTANRVVSGKNENISAQELASITELYISSIESIRKGSLEKSRLIKKLENEKQKLERQLNGILQSSRQPSNDIIISVSAERQVSAKLLISYLVSGAGWYPSYDIRVKNIADDVSFCYKANVFQNTGNGWDNVLLSFSSANPSASGVIPVLTPYYLNFFTPSIVRERSISAAVASKKAKPIEESEIMLGDYEMPDASAPPVTIKRTQTAFSFDVSIPQDVKPDGRIKTIDLQHLETGAIFKYISVPKIMEKAFLSADIPDWESLNLLNGDANIYFGNTFTGNTMINTEQLPDTLNIGLGIDNNVSVERIIRKEFTSTKTLGTNRIETRSFKINLKNNKSRAIDIDIYDQLPVSQNKDIEVDAKELSGGLMNEFTGEVKWQTSIPAGESKEFILTYTVKYPKNKKVILD
ncbi:MAG TPA: hypothetical protein DEQ09_02150 [Bacteroidales bacterium]|nr:hypothetical protein [Bacteroidales bacterium]